MNCVRERCPSLMGYDIIYNNHTYDEEKVMKTYKTEQTIRKYDGAILTWSLTDDGPPYTGKVKGKTVIYWQRKRWLLTNVEYRA